ncbi:MAG: HlyD family secretion protein [Runella sp.]
MNNQTKLSSESGKYLGRWLDTPPSGGGGLVFFQELRSEEVQELLSNAPPWALRWGNTFFFVVLMGVLGLSFVIKYPEIITAPFLLTSTDTPKPVVAKTNGRLVKLWVEDNTPVQQGQLLAFLESNASHLEVLALEQALDSLSDLVNRGQFEAIFRFRSQDFRHLGELQTDYQTFIQSFTETVTLFAAGYLGKRRAFIAAELADLQQHQQQLQQQLSLQHQELQMAEREFEMHQKLYEQRVISWAEYQREQRSLLAKQMPLKQLEMSLTANQTSQTQKRKESVELDKQANDQKVKFGQALGALRAAVGAWKMRYVPTAPRAGRVLFAASWQEQQMVKGEEVLFYVGSEQKGYVGEAKIRQVNAGKVREGQRVLIKLASYPFEQYGMIEGKIEQIAAMVSPDSTFRAVIVLPHGLQTTSQKIIPFKNGLTATAGIITDEVSVAQRLFFQWRMLYQK